MNNTLIKELYNSYLNKQYIILFVLPFVLSYITFKIYYTMQYKITKILITNNENIDYKSLYTLENEVKVNNFKIIENDITIQKYSEKSYVIRGQKTKNIKENLKKLGCKWNFNLKGGCGWIVSTNKFNNIKTYLLKIGYKIQEL
jgi:hypothetical protein